MPTLRVYRASCLVYTDSVSEPRDLPATAMGAGPTG
jgi:hypothetical protein